MSQYIEIKTVENIYPYQARKIIAKGTVKIVITMGTISPNAKLLFDNAGILWVEEIPEKLFADQGKRIKITQPLSSKDCVILQ
jgi:hypothetical protein